MDNFVGKCEQAKFCSFDGKRSAHYTCKELPEFSEFYVYCLGQEMEICNQMFGGKCKVKVCKTGDACFETTVESPTLGCMKIVDKFCKEGIDRVNLDFRPWSFKPAINIKEWDYRFFL